MWNRSPVTFAQLVFLERLSFCSLIRVRHESSILISDWPFLLLLPRLIVCFLLPVEREGPSVLLHDRGGAGEEESGGGAEGRTSRQRWGLEKKINVSVATELKSVRLRLACKRGFLRFFPSPSRSRVPGHRSRPEALPLPRLGPPRAPPLGHAPLRLPGGASAGQPLLPAGGPQGRQDQAVRPAQQVGDLADLHAAAAARLR